MVVSVLPVLAVVVWVVAVAFLVGWALGLYGRNW